MSVTVIHSAPKVSPKANDAAQPSKREVEASGADEPFSESLNEEINAIQNDAKTENEQHNESEQDSDQVGQKNSALDYNILPPSLSKIKSEDIDLDGTIDALKDIVAQLGDTEELDLLDNHFALQNAQVQLDKQLNRKAESMGLNTAKQALLNAAEQAKTVTDKIEVATPVLFKAEEIKNGNKGYSELAKDLGATKSGLNLSSLNSSIKPELVTSDLPSDKLVTKLPDLSLSTQLQGNDNSANKNIVADLASLNRQVESMQANKQDVPAMTKPLNHPEWKQEFNDRIIWMQNKGVSSVELRINPNNLGPIAISIKMDADQQASIAINVHNGAVRDAVESALPRLREMLNAQQIALADVNVSQQQQGQNNARQAMEDAQQEHNKENAGKLDHLGENNSESDNLADEINLGRAVASNGLLSLYA